MNKLTAILFIALAILVTALIVGNDMTTGWAQQNTWDRVQARAQRAEAFKLQQEQDAIITKSWTTGEAGFIPVLWGVVSFVIVSLAILLVVKIAMGTIIVRVDRQLPDERVRVIDAPSRKEITSDDNYIVPVSKSEIWRVK